MPDRPSSNYSLRARPHTKTLIAKRTQLNDQDFIIRSIYKDSHWLHFKHIHHHFNRALYVYYCPSCEQFYLFYLSLYSLVLYTWLRVSINLLLKKMMDGWKTTTLYALEVCPLKAKIRYTSFPVASPQQVRNINDKSVTSCRGQKSVVSVVSCRFSNSITTTCCGLVGRVANKSVTIRQLLRLRGSYGETCNGFWVGWSVLNRNT